MKKRVYISDLDFTLLNENAELSDTCKERINYLLDQGIHFTVASARSIQSITHILEGVNLKLPVVTLNGTMVSDFDTRKHLYTNTIPWNEIEKLWSYAQSFDHTPFFLTIDKEGVERLYPSHNKNEGVEWMLNNRKEIGDKRLFTGKFDLEEVKKNEQLMSMVFIGEEETLKKIHAYEDENFSFESHCSSYFYENPYTKGWFWIDIHHKNSKKCEGIKQLLQLSGMEDHEVVVFGDQANDITMFQNAHRAYAVENAISELKKIATGIIGHHSQGAVLDFIYRENRL